MNTSGLIAELGKSKLIAECPCGEQFALSDAILFDGLGKTPSQAEEIKLALLSDLKEREDALKKQKLSAQEGAEQKAIEVGIGKIVEKIIPTYADFTIPITDCRPLFEPIDLIAFNGLSDGNTASITFMEIKTGKARLNGHQRMVRDAIEDHQVAYKEI